MIERVIAAANEHALDSGDAAYAQGDLEEALRMLFALLGTKEQRKFSARWERSDLSRWEKK